MYTVAIVAIPKSVRKAKTYFLSFIALTTISLPIQDIGLSLTNPSKILDGSDSALSMLPIPYPAPLIQMLQCLPYWDILKVPDVV